MAIKLQEAQHEVRSKDKENDLIQLLKNDLKETKNYLVQGLINEGLKKKEINVNDPDVKKTIENLIYSDPADPKNISSKPNAKNDVKSIIATIKNNNEQITKWEQEGYNPEAFKGVKEEMEKLPKQLEAELSSQKNVDNLVNERVKNRIFMYANFAKENQPIFKDEKDALISKINKYVEISQDTVSALLKNEKLLDPLVRQITKNASDFFGKDGANVKNVCVLDEKKLTDENILKFTYETNHAIKSFESVQKGINNLDVAKNKQVTETLLSKLDTDYITKYNNTIINELQTVSNKGTSFLEKIQAVFTGKDYLREKLENVLDTHIKANNKHIDNKITTLSKGLKNNEFVTGLKHFIDENTKKISDNSKLRNVNLNEIHNNKAALVELRKINPHRFDQTVFEDSKRLALKSKPHNIKIESPTATPNFSNKKSQTIIR
ncbi:MAG TPA: hypothetical protein LFV66_01840 [Rickettsia endosymbiont of Bembidion lapponicum]|nr:hypothetical protein [Rickettsia endosymbiont of Bembidion lapponicum]